MAQSFTQAEFDAFQRSKNDLQDSFLKTQDQLRIGNNADAIQDQGQSISGSDWDLSYLWDAKFINKSGRNPLPKPFDVWAPFTSIDENLWTLETKSFDFYMSDYSIPWKSAEFTISASYIDLQDRRFTRWMQYWINTEILNGGLYVTPLQDAARELHVLKLNSAKRAVGLSRYLVIPEGSSAYQGTSEAGLPEYSVNFKIVGHLD